MNWAENHIKLAAAKANLMPHTMDNQGRRVTLAGPAPAEEDLMKEYIRMGGRVVHPETGEIIDNNLGADRDETGQVTQRYPEKYEARVSELIAAFKGEKAKPKPKK